MSGRFLSNRDISNLIDRANKEVLKTVVGQTCVLYKHEVSEIKTNVYGEAPGKNYYEPLKIACLIDRSDQTWTSDDFGSDVNQSHNFMFLKNELANVSNVKGYYAKAKMETDATNKVELFAVGSEIAQSSK